MRLLFTRSGLTHFGSENPVSSSGYVGGEVDGVLKLENLQPKNGLMDEIACVYFRASRPLRAHPGMPDVRKCVFRISFVTKL